MRLRTYCCIAAMDGSVFFHPARRANVTCMRRRGFITLFGSAAVAWPLAAHAQQLAIPVVGHLSGRSPNDSAANVAAFHRGLSEVGFFDGQNVEIDFRWAL